MHHTALGRTGLHVSVAGLGTGGFSKRSPDERSDIRDTHVS